MNNSKSEKFLLQVFLFVLVFSCSPDIVLKSDHGFPDEPVNLEMFNSKYDDYNSNIAPGVSDMFAFIFSSNRNSKGKDYDFNIFSLGMS